MASRSGAYPQSGSPTSYDNYSTGRSSNASNASRQNQNTSPPSLPTSSSSNILNMRERLSAGVEQVRLSADVYFVCMTHALTTEKDEICGLLLGQPSENGRRIDITACYPLPRGTHRQKDRVEITPIQMALGVEHAEALQKSHGMNVRVVGWYHSHPRLMPIPSSVDVASQEACEQQDATFVGLIFTPFNSASKQTPHTQQLQLLAFKTDRSQSLGFRQLPIHVLDFGGRGRSGLGGLSRWAMDTLVELLRVLMHEEDDLMSQVEPDGKTNNFLANNAYCYRLMRVMNEIGYPLIAALESRLECREGESLRGSLTANYGVKTDRESPRSLIDSSLPAGYVVEPPMQRSSQSQHHTHSSTSSMTSHRSQTGSTSSTGSGQHPTAVNHTPRTHHINIPVNAYVSSQKAHQKTSGEKSHYGTNV